MGVIRSRVRQSLMMLAVARKDPPRHNQRLRTALAVENLYLFLFLAGVAK